ncbi:MAG: OmpW family protein, partial [Rhizobium pusense]|nr:OmpW family protein [Agrobacterium pusense]
KLASTWVLPPTLTAQYHFNPKGAVRPYVGAGINYTIFWNEKASDGLQAAVGKKSGRHGVTVRFVETMRLGNSTCTGAGRSFRTVRIFAKERQAPG